jgi:hypothetical protein
MEKIKNHKQANPYKVPEDYFALLNERIIANCESESGADAAGKRPGIIKMLRPLITLAAIISGAALITFAIVQSVAPSNRGPQPIADAALTDHSELIFENIDIYMIEAALYDSGESDLQSLTFGKDEIIDYLLAGEVEFSLIYEHLGDGTEL